MLAIKRQLGINLVAQHEQIFFDSKLRNRFQLRAIARASGGVARQVQHEQLATGLPRGNERFGSQ